MWSELWVAVFIGAVNVGIEIYLKNYVASEYQMRSV